VAKGGIKLLTRAMTTEWTEHGIQINTIAPGYMITEMTKSLVETPSFDGWVKQRTPAPLGSALGPRRHRHLFGLRRIGLCEWSANIR
jgi:NAD(P)-dependent dehydrogenase (short-subunit alcohol dehydrogenase family)